MNADTIATTELQSALIDANAQLDDALRMNRGLQRDLEHCAAALSVAEEERDGLQSRCAAISEQLHTVNALLMGYYRATPIDKAAAATAIMRYVKELQHE